MFLSVSPNTHVLHITKLTGVWQTLLSNLFMEQCVLMVRISRGACIKLCEGEGFQSLPSGQNVSNVLSFLEFQIIHGQ